MLNVIIVDDEPLLRSGIIHSIRWEEFDMCVVGQAGSVSEAITLIKSGCNVNIVFTDMIMPGENGIVLLQWLHDHRPDITPVVLSYHNDFPLVQEALRLGITDYIIKTELYQEDFRKTLSNIVLRTKLNLSRKDFTTLQAYTYRSALVFKCTDEDGDSYNRIGIPDNSVHYPVSHGTYLEMLENELDEDQLSGIEQLYQGKWIILYLKADGISVTDIIQSVNIYFARDFFYEKIPSLSLYHLNPKKVLSFRKNFTGPDYVSLEQELSSIRWIRDADQLQKILDRMRDARLSPETVYNLFYCVQSKWNTLFPNDEFPSAIPVVNIRYWYQWQDWIWNFYTFASSLNNTNSYSPEVIRSIRCLVQWLEDHFMEDISLPKAAQEANLSPSYLSRCFHDFTGCSFSQYLRNIRVNYAKQMLRNSDLSVGRIAELCGFQDRSYFDKTFKKELGISPSSFRHSS